MEEAARERLIERAEELTTEMRQVMQHLRELQTRSQHLQEHRLRLEGAIQALTDLAKEMAVVPMSDMDGWEARNGDAPKEVEPTTIMLVQPEPGDREAAKAIIKAGRRKARVPMPSEVASKALELA